MAELQAKKVTNGKKKKETTAIHTGLGKAQRSGLAHEGAAAAKKTGPGQRLERGSSKAKRDTGANNQKRDDLQVPELQTQSSPGKKPKPHRRPRLCTRGRGSKTHADTAR